MADPASSPELSPLKRALLALDKMQARLNALEEEKREPIAVIGMSCRFPGGVDSPESFWRLLLEGRDAVGTYPSKRPGSAAWNTASHDTEKVRLIKQGGFLAAVDQFDPGFFGISPREAMRMDPQQRILLQVACEALEAAGLVFETLAGSRTGVFVGLHSQSSDYYALQTAHPEEMDTYTSTGSAHSIAANRLSYVLDLRGPSVVVDTACSSSLVALHLACQSLRARESNVALAGGVNLILAPETSLAFSKLEFLSIDGRCKTFDASANGFVRAEGCGMIVLKRLADALRDGDPVLAVVRGTAVNQDGATNGLTAPSGFSQQAVIKAALENGRVDPALITLVETHGTGTPLGDPIEVDALRSVFGGSVRRALGSVKTNIGHTEAAAGIAGVIKCILALQHRTIPANLHFSTLNPHISLEGSAFFIPTRPVSWENPGPGRFAAVSSFGFGGTNGHVILQEASAVSAEAPVPQEESPKAVLLPISARSEGALAKLALSWRKRLSDLAATESLSDLVHTGGVRRSHHPHRIAVVGTSAHELRARLEELEAGRSPAGLVHRPVGNDPPRVAFILCGQGPQWWGMGRELLQSEPEFRRVMSQCAVEMKHHVAWDLLTELSRTESDSRLGETEIAQPALFALQLALAAVWRSWGIEPHAILGHSVGEVAAACIAGVLSLPDAINVICQRGKIMQRATGLGRMAAIELPGAEVERLLEAVGSRATIAAFNSPTSTVISGETAAVEQIVVLARDRGARTRLLPVNYAFHSPQMEPFQEPMIAAVADITTHPASIPVYAAVTGGAATERDFDAAYWGRNLREPVRFAPALEAMLQDDLDTFVEISPQPVLSAMVAQCAEAVGRQVRVHSSLRPNQPERAHMLSTLAALYVQGAAIRWRSVGPSGRHVALPAYPWQSKSFWLEPSGTTPLPNSRTGLPPVNNSPEPRQGRRLESPGITGFIFEKRLDLASAGFVRDHQILGACIVPAPVLMEMVLGGAAEALALGVTEMQEMVLHRALLLTPASGRSVHLVFEPPRDGLAAFSIHSRAIETGPSSEWRLHASGRVRLPDEIRVRAVAQRPQLELDVVRAQLADEMLPGRFYDFFDQRGANFGPAFRVVEKLQRGGLEALVEISLPKFLETDASGFFLHPVLWDAALQALAILRAVPSDGAAEPDSLFLFCGFDELRTYATGDSRLVCHARLEPDGADGRGAFRGGVQLYTRAGRLVAEITGARFLPADRDTLTASDGASVEQLIHEVRWQPQHNPVHPLRRAAPVYLPTLSQAMAAAEVFLREQNRDPQNVSQPEVVAAFDAQSILFIKHALRRLGWVAPAGTRFTTADLIGRHKILAKHTRLLGRMLEMLVEEGTLQHDSAGWEVVRPLRRTETPVALAELVARFPDHRAELELFDRCASRLEEVLQGRCDPLQLLFPEGSTESATQVYQDAPMSRLPNALVRVLCERIRDAVPPHGVLRVLEIGAGTGGTTAHLLPMLQSRPCEYVFSDISQLFLRDARERFAAHPFVRFSLLDIERSPAGQGFAPGQFDLIIAANVIHATQDLRRTLVHVRSLLAPGGLVALIEGFRPSRWIDLVFGQTEGWWRFSDLALRPAHPLLPLETWCRILRDEGFADATGIAAKVRDEPGLFDQAVILGKASEAIPFDVPALATAATEPSSWLVIGDASGSARRFGDLLTGQGHRVARIAHERIEMDLAATLTSSPQPCNHVVMFADADLVDSVGDAGAMFAQAAALTCRALAAAQVLIQNPRVPRPRLWLVTAGAQPAGRVAALHPGSAPLWGLGRVVAVEHPEIWGGLIDLESGADDPAGAESVMAHIQHYDGEDQCAFRAGLRYVPRLGFQPRAEATTSSLKVDGCYIVTGGLGGLGLHMAQWFATQGARKLVLIGRTSLPPRSDWGNIASGTRLHEQITAIEEIERRGASVRMVGVDIANQSELVRAIAELRDAGWFPIRGVVHAAAAIDDRLVPQLDAAGVVAAMRPKILGALNLEQCLADEPLEFFVCCSSVGSLLGQAGQANYAAANAFLDCYVHHRHARGLPALGINWGGWYGAGFAVTAGGRRTIQSLEQRGILGFTPADGVAALGLLLPRATTQAIVIRLDAKKFRQSYPPGEEPPFLRDLVGGVPSARTGTPPNTAAGATRINVRQQLLDLESSAARREQLQAHITSLLAAVLKLESAAIDAETPMGTLGLDSLMGFELKNLCERSLDLTLSATMAWNYPTVAALTGFLAEKLGVALRDEAGPAVDGDSPMAVPMGSGVDELSEEQALHSLLKRRSPAES